jgi:uncharacterized membrane protein YphA (DoxX/SURF4 family)
MSQNDSLGLIGKTISTFVRATTGWGRPHRNLGMLGVAMLVLLRVCVGFHFYTEGLDKRSGDFDAGKFFATARGPFAEHFQKQIWDWNGNVRLNAERSGSYWGSYGGRAVKHFGFDKADESKAAKAIARANAQLAWILETNATAIQEFELGKTRLEKLGNDSVRDGVDSLGGQRESIRKEWLGLITPVFAQIDKTWENLETEMNSIPGADVLARKGKIRLGRPRDVAIDTSVINPIIPYFDLAIGVCLILGLFTPVAALIAAAFLGSVFMSQFPPTAGPGSTYYHMVEAAACLVLASTGAGRFAGIDFIFYAISTRLWPTTSER